jgi:hypothetical protein
MITRILAIIVFFGLTSAAHAFSIVAWGAAGTTCVPDRGTINKFEAVNPATLRHLGAQVGSLLFTCNVERIDSLNQSWSLRITYRDSTGMGATASVVAQLYRIPLQGFSPILVGTASSDSSGAMGSTTLISPFSHTFDFEANSYFVRLALTRAASTEIVRLSSVSIEIGSPD